MHHARSLALLSFSPWSPLRDRRSSRQLAFACLLFAQFWAAYGACTSEVSRSPWPPSPHTRLGRWTRIKNKARHHNDIECVLVGDVSKYLPGMPLHVTVRLGTFMPLHRWETPKISAWFPTPRAETHTTSRLISSECLPLLQVLSSRIASHVQQSP